MQVYFLILYLLITIKLKMPGYNIEGKRIVISDDKYKDIYWPELSELLKEKFFQTEVEITDPKTVGEILKFSFTFFCKNWRTRFKVKKDFHFTYFVIIYMKIQLSCIKTN